MVRKDGGLDSFQLDILTREVLFQNQEARFMFGFIVVAILNLALEGSKLTGFITGAGINPTNDCPSCLDVEKIELNWIISINILIREEDFPSEGEHMVLFNALFTK